jgi:mycothiol system anti-sigma-R factor
MNCDESFEVLYRFLDKDLESGTCDEVEVHLKICRPCWDRFEFEKKLKARFQKCCSEQIPEHLEARIKALLEKY